MRTERGAQAHTVSRRGQILAAALREFSHKGFHGASTLTIAEAAGSSHPGLFRTFPTKKGLFIAVLEQVFATVRQELAVADKAAGDDQVHAAVIAWRALMEERELMLLLIQGYAACEDPDIHDLMYRWTREAFGRMEALSRTGADSSPRPFATAMLYMVASCMDLTARVEGEAWVGRLLAATADP